ncbi:hypothetical protein [Chitinophaga sp.]|uniref:hypothetical protein n=1 Tax=Chitinophaga sp. TaxID=1869181 RepID=UPI0031DCFE1C
MILYALKVIICSGLLLLVYRLLLERARLHRFSRAYLLAALMLPLLAPLVTVQGPAGGVVERMAEYSGVAGWFMKADAETNTGSLAKANPASLTETNAENSSKANTANATGTNTKAAETGPGNFPNSNAGNHTTINTGSMSADAAYYSTGTPARWLPAIYIALTTLLLLRLIRNLYRIYAKTRGCKKTPYHRAWVIETGEAVAPYAFLRYVFVGNATTIPTPMLQHEYAHARELHSIDILLAELLLVCCWWNPVLWLYKKAIRLNHEFLADGAALGHCSLQDYQQLVFNALANPQYIPITSGLHFAAIKKRFLMMTTHTTRTSALLRQLAIIPLAGTALLLAAAAAPGKPPVNAQTAVAPQDTLPVKAQQKRKAVPPPKIERINFTPSPKAKTAARDTFPPPRIERVNLTPSPKAKTAARDTFPPPVITRRTLAPGKGASQEELDEYAALAKKVNTKIRTESGRDMYQLDGKTHARMIEIYRKMDGPQRLNAPALKINVDMTGNPPPPPVKISPTASQLTAWKNASKYGVWIDGKRASNEALNKYRPADFVLFHESRLEHNAINYGKHYFQVDLYTAPYYNEVFKSRL